MTDAPERTHYADEETLRYIRELEQRREWCPEDAFATHGNDAEWVCDCYACNERRDLICAVERLRAAIRQALQELRDDGGDPYAASEATARMLHRVLANIEEEE